MSASVPVTSTVATMWVQGIPASRATVLRMHHQQLNEGKTASVSHDVRCQRHRALCLVLPFLT